MNELSRVHVEIGNWQTLGCDVIIIPSYPSYVKRYGLSNEIYRSAGKTLESECLEFSLGREGDVRITRAYQLVKYGIGWLIHGVSSKENREEKEEEEMMGNLYRRCFQRCIDYDTDYRRQSANLAGQYYSGEKLASYLEHVERYIKNHPVRRIGIIPLKQYRNNKERGVNQTLKEINEFLSQDKQIVAIHILCEDIGSYNEYLKIIKDKSNNLKGGKIWSE